MEGFFEYITSLSFFFLCVFGVYILIPFACAFAFTVSD